MTETQILSQRVGRLERENRILKCFALLFACALLALMSMAASSKPRTVEAEKFVLRDSKGHARVTIGTPEFAGPTILTKATDPVVWLTDERGNDRAVLTMDGLRFIDARTEATLAITSETGKSAITIYGTDRKVAWSAP